MNDNLELVDVSDTNKPKKKDWFMKFIYIALVLLVILFIIVYFFGYNILKPYIEV